ncbi:hypothetical protein OIU74_021527 [Salix koriyanagi]|uniref:Uncharacterized protein n=1 Tax=Salix koriyanagi TaxID=2511006 RepID=A0A9Q0WJR4_9ROSI|nr:hypothetical protein OIU74_021527 [Salix koriyanagi]
METNGPFLLTEILPASISDSVTTLEEMTDVLDQPVVDYNLLGQPRIKLEGGTSW